MMFSVDLRDNINYAVSFFPDMEVRVPGGYGSYRMGALGKLVALEHKPEIFSKTFSLGTSTFIDYYFYPSSGEVYYGNDEDSSIVFPGMSELLQMKSNAQFFDRIYLSYLFFKENQKQFKQLRSLAPQFFIKEYQGYFYHKVYREEKKNVGVVYRNRYTTAEMIGTLLEGVGIRVSDYKEAKDSEKKCYVMEQAEQYSQTAKDISKFFHCGLKKGNTDVYDIIFSIGTLENDWEVN